MTTRVATGTVALSSGLSCFTIRLQAPRSNALEPRLLADLASAFDEFDASGAPCALISGGRNFSSGGDVARFHQAAANDTAEEYAMEVVPRLQDLLGRMLASPRLIAVAARGAITGGSAGFVFAADLVVLAPDAFLQPYYSTVGFAPDGGWTAILPERLGAGRAQGWLISDARVGAAEAQAMGLAAEVVADPEAAVLDRLGRIDLDAARAAKALIWDADRRAAVEARLAAETEAFRTRIVSEQARRGMARFLEAARAVQDA